MNIISAIDYFKLLCEKHKEIGNSNNNSHFFRDHQDAENHMKSEAFGVIFVMGPFESVVESPNLDNNVEKPMISFVLAEYVPTDDLDKKFEIYAKTKQIGIDILSRILLDQKCQEHEFLKEFKPSGVHWESVGPMKNNYYGTIFDIEIMDGLDLTYHPDKWLP